MAKVVTMAQQKGGSGKTTVTIHLAVELARRGLRVAVLDLDPQGSLGRWFMIRLDRHPSATGDIGFGTASAWGVTYEVSKNARTHDVILIDTPPKIDGDLRPALKVADLVVVPVSASEVDLWATEGVLELAAREKRRPLAVLNRARAGTRLTDKIRAAITELDADPAETVLAQRVAYAEAIGAGQGICEYPGAKAGAAEVAALADEVLDRLGPIG
ncbi:ParA family partition ATPase [Jannaschia sp. LMIT008]|uniref:ParA family partition ATPase n=1 Tax=Jannaschia maritima TaxID=3032585 RepID=UPI0028123F1D|nr:ParA family partition ATPase [Jannaschia sp. LMIT008]